MDGLHWFLIAVWFISIILALFQYNLARSYEVACDAKNMKIQALEDLMNMVWEGSGENYREHMHIYYKERLRQYMEELDDELG
jgi:hypothetical protein